MTNPLSRPSGRMFPAKSVEEHVRWLNTFAWVQASRLPYFVNQRMEDGQMVKFVDRRDKAA